jgi:hypothetical protein
MADERMPYQIIADLASSFAKLSDPEVLAKLEAVPPLADEDDPCWDDEYWAKVAFPFIALWRVAAQRKLFPAVTMILDRACFGDPGETMRNICHAIEGIVKPDWASLTTSCVAALASPRRGTRMWAAHELIRLRDPDAISALQRAAKDEEPEVRDLAIMALDNTTE